MILSAVASLAACVGGAGGVTAFSTPVQSQSRRPITVTTSSTALFAGGGFGANKSPSKKKKKKKSKSKSAGLLDELDLSSAGPSSSSSSSSSSEASPKLDRFGLPIQTEDDVFPPLSPDISRIPVDRGGGEHIFDRGEVADAIEGHLGVNLDAFDEDGYSIHEERRSADSAATRWSLKLLHRDPPVFQIDDFFAADECEAYKSLMEPSDGDRRPRAVQITSPTFSSSSLSVSRRTSTTWFCRYDGVPALLAKARHLLNVDVSRMEEPQIVRYRTGEEFSWHYDEIPSAQLSNGGQRLATLLVYLNDLDEGRGGGTVFRDLAPPNTSKGSKRKKGDVQELTVRPRTGTALLFFPSYKDGTPDVRTLHKGEVALDTKMIAQLWIHEREYSAGVPEGNLQEDAAEGVDRESRRLGLL